MTVTGRTLIRQTPFPGQTGPGQSVAGQRLTGQMPGGQAVAGQIVQAASAALPAGLTPALTVGCFVNMLSTLALAPFLPAIADEMGASVSLLGQIPSLTSLLAALLGLVAGPLADRYGYRSMVTIGLVTATVSTLGIAGAPGLLLLFVAGLFGAVGRSVVQSASLALVGTLIHEEARRRRAMTWISSGTTATPLIGIPLLTTLAAVTSWRVSFLTIGILALVMACLVYRLLPTDASRASGALRVRDVLHAYGPLLRHRPSVVLILSSLLTNLGTWATFTYMAAFFVTIHGFSTSEVGVTFMAVGIGTVVGTVLVGGRLGAQPRLLLILGRVVGGVAVLLALALPLPPLVALTLLAVTAMMSTMSSACTTVMLASDAPGGRGTTLTLYASALSLGTALGAALGGLMLAVADFRLVGIVSMFTFVAGALLVWLFHTSRAPVAR